MGLLPSRVFADPDPDEPRVLDIEGSDADRTFEALSSDTARRILGAVYDQPRTPTEVHEEVGTSLQNVHYHLDKLESAELIEPAGTGYSEKGNEMTVFAPRSEALVLFAGTERDRSQFESLLGRVLGLSTVLAASTLAVSILTQEEEETTSQTVSVAAEESAKVTETAGSSGFFDLAAMDPAAVFFLGGATMLVVLSVLWYVRE